MAATVCLGERMKKVMSPCYKCEDRVVGCHSRCEKYLEYSGIMASNREENYENHRRQARLGVVKTPTALKRMGVNKEKR